MTAVSSFAKERTGTVSEAKVAGTLNSDTVGGVVSVPGVRVMVTVAARPSETLPAASLA